MRLDAARDALFRWALAYAEKPLSDENQRGLCDAASAYAVERTKTKPRNQAREAATLTVPFGHSKGLPLNEAKTGDLTWVRERIEESLADPSKQRWADKNRELAAAIDRELESR